MSINLLELPSTIIVTTPPDVHGCRRTEFGRVYAEDAPLTMRGMWARDGIVDHMLRHYRHIDILLAGRASAARAAQQHFCQRMGITLNDDVFKAVSDLNERKGLEHMAGRSTSEFLRAESGVVESMYDVRRRIELALARLQSEEIRTAWICAPEMVAFYLCEILNGDVRESGAYQFMRWSESAGLSPASMTVLERSPDSQLYVATMYDTIVWQ